MEGERGRVRGRAPNANETQQELAFRNGNTAGQSSLEIKIRPDFFFHLNYLIGSEPKSLQSDLLLFMFVIPCV